LCLHITLYHTVSYQTVSYHTVSLATLVQTFSLQYQKKMIKTVYSNEKFLI